MEEQEGACMARSPVVRGDTEEWVRGDLLAVSWRVLGPVYL